MANILKLLLAPFVLYALLTGGLSYLVVFLIDHKLNLTPRTRAVLYVTVLVAPLLTYAAYLWHLWRTCAGSYTEFYNRLCALSVRYANLLTPITFFLLSGYIAYRTFIYMGLPIRSRKRSTNTAQCQRVTRIMYALRSSAQVEIWDNCYPSAFVRGYRTPQIVLTSGLIDVLDDEELEGVIRHELAHVLSHDNYLNWVVVFRELTFFSPFAQVAYRSFSQAREEAADYLATHDSEELSLALASALIKVSKRAQELLRLTRPSIATSYFAGAQGITRRVELLVNGERKYSPLSPAYPIVILTALVMLIC